MERYRLLLLLISIIPFCNRAIPNDLYWECVAEGIDPDLIYDLLEQGDLETLELIIKETEGEDIYDLGAEDLFRLEVLQDLEASGIEYVDGQFHLQAEIHNS